MAESSEKIVVDEKPYHQWKYLTVLVGIALFVRLAWLRHGLGITPDGESYLSGARSLAFQHIFSESTTNLIPTAKHPPLYSMLIAALWWGDRVPLTALAIVQACLGIATVALVYLIARRHFNGTVALVAATGMALAPMSSYYTTLVLTETVFTFLVTVGIFFWSRQQHVLCGVAFGLAVLTRTTMLPFLFLLLLLPLLPAWRQRWKAHLAIALIALALAATWTVRNALVFHKFIPVAANGVGINLLFGTIETSLTGGQMWTGTRWTKYQPEIPLLWMDEGLPEAEKDRARARRALARIADDPLHWVVVRAKQYPKLFVDTGSYVLNPEIRPDADETQGMRASSLMIKAIFALGNLVVLLLALFALFIERARFIILSHIMLFPLFLSIIHLPMWIEPRYSLPMVPSVAILASVGAVRLYRKYRVAKPLAENPSPA